MNFHQSMEINHYVQEELAGLNKDSLRKFLEEKEHLKNIPLHDYAIGRFGIGKVDSTYCLAYIDSNRYSGIEAYIGKEVRYSIINDLVVFYYGNKEICRHKKIEDNNSYSIDIRHYLKTLHKKPGAVARSLALKQADEEIISIYQNKYINDPKGFIDYLFGRDIKEIKSSVAAVSLNQLKQINKTFSLGVNHE